MKNILKISFHENTNVLICKVWKKNCSLVNLWKYDFFGDKSQEEVSQKWKKWENCVFFPKYFYRTYDLVLPLKCAKTPISSHPTNWYSLCTILSSCVRFSQCTFLLLKLSKPYRPAVWILDILQNLYFIF